MWALLDNGLYVFLALAVISALSEWLKKRRKGEAEDEEVPPPFSRPYGEDSADRPTSWRERVLEEIRGLQEPPSKPVAPPVVVASSTRRPSPPSPSPSRSTYSNEGDVKAAQAEMEKIRGQQRKAKAKLEAIRSKQTPGSPGAIRSSSRSGDIGPWLHGRRGLRRAVIAHTILSPPKAFDLGGGSGHQMR